MSITQFIAERACAVCPPRARRKDARPGELLDAALDLFVEKGFAATRVEEVAQRAGVSKGTLFLYFSSKEELFKAAVRQHLSAQFPLWNAELDAFGGSTVELLRSFYRHWWERVGATKTSGLTKLILSEAGNFPDMAVFYHAEVIAPGNAMIRRILERGIERGEFRSLNLDYAVYSVLSPMIFLMMWKHSLGACASAECQHRLDPLQYLDQQTEILLQGLCAPAGTDTPRTLGRTAQ